MGHFRLNEMTMLPDDVDCDGNLQASKQAVSLIKNLTNADNDNSMNMSTKMEMSQVNKPANKVQTMQYVKINIQTYKHQ